LSTCASCPFTINYFWSIASKNNPPYERLANSNSNCDQYSTYYYVLTWFGPSIVIISLPPLFLYLQQYLKYKLINKWHFLCNSINVNKQIKAIYLIKLIKNSNQLKVIQKQWKKMSIQICFIFLIFKFFSLVHKITTYQNILRDFIVKIWQKSMKKLINEMLLKWFYLTMIWLNIVLNGS